MSTSPHAAPSGTTRPPFFARASAFHEIFDYQVLSCGRSSNPPLYSQPWHDPVIDAGTQTFRTVLTQCERHSAATLLRQQFVLYGEETYLKAQRRRRRLKHGLLKFRMAYRGFLHLLQIKRRRPVDAVTEFLEWVRHHSPEWSSDVERELTELDPTLTAATTWREVRQELGCSDSDVDED